MTCRRRSACSASWPAIKKIPWSSMAERPPSLPRCTISRRNSRSPCSRLPQAGVGDCRASIRGYSGRCRCPSRRSRCSGRRGAPSLSDRRRKIGAERQRFQGVGPTQRNRNRGAAVQVQGNRLLGPTDSDRSGQGDYGVFTVMALGTYITLSAHQISIGHGALAGIDAYTTAVPQREVRHARRHLGGRGRARRPRRRVARRLHDLASAQGHAPRHWHVRLRRGAGGVVTQPRMCRRRARVPAYSRHYRPVASLQHYRDPYVPAVALREVEHGAGVSLGVRRRGHGRLPWRQRRPRQDLGLGLRRHDHRHRRRALRPSVGGYPARQFRVQVLHTHSARRPASAVSERSGALTSAPP